MIETLYRTRNPQTVGWAHQCFEMAMGEVTVDHQLGYYVRETQCWFDGAKKRIIRIQYTLSPREGFPSVEQAEKRYEAQKVFRARQGYVHCYAPRYEATKPSRYTRIEIPAAPVLPEEPQPVAQVGEQCEGAPPAGEAV